MRNDKLNHGTAQRSMFLGRAAVSSMNSVTVKIVTFSGEGSFTLPLPMETTVWQLEKHVRTVLGVPRKSQNLLIGERLAAAGEILSSFSADPLVVTLVQTQPSCKYCGVLALRLKRCSSCDDVHYCGPLCQTLDWPRHRSACRSTEVPQQCG